ncbi:hypothetical protein ACXR4C_000681 [Campylobacter jejuni]|nr:Uncharacterised protein [Campylobacter jejuni subsp. doylei]
MSAKQRIKNHLAYKLGQLLLDYGKRKNLKSYTLLEKENLEQRYGFYSKWGGGFNTLTL